MYHYLIQIQLQNALLVYVCGRVGAAEAAGARFPPGNIGIMAARIRSFLVSARLQIYPPQFDSRASLRIAVGADDPEREGLWGQ
jgi:hypothetical protein